jgi:hypothetical protein
MASLLGICQVQIEAAKVGLLGKVVVHLEIIAYQLRECLDDRELRNEGELVLHVKNG